jgi:hypothetical protein
MIERGTFEGVESLQLSLDMPKLCAMPLLKAITLIVQKYS